MIGNRYIEELFKYSDEDASFNQLLELLKYQDTAFIDSLYKEKVDVDLCDEKEIEYLTKAAALIDFYFQKHGIEVPDWLRNSKLIFDKPYFHSKRIDDFEKVKLQYTVPAPFKIRNVYFDLNGIERI